MPTNLCKKFQPYNFLWRHFNAKKKNLSGWNQNLRSGIVLGIDNIAECNDDETEVKLKKKEKGDTKQRWLTSTINVNNAGQAKRCKNAFLEN